MALDSEGFWVPDLFPRQKELLEACQPSDQNLILANGPRWASKTFGCQHAVCQHAWETDRADICILTLTQSLGVDSGVWQHLTEIFIPMWIEGDFGFNWIRQPYFHNVTKKPGCEVTNRHGTKSRISLQSLKNEKEVENLFKSKAYSMIWINELSKFKTRKTFDTLKQCLRMPHLSTDQHLLLADTNPDIDIGVESWIYKLWYEFKSADQDELTRLFSGAKIEDLIPLQKALKLIEFTVDDNLSLSDEKKAQLRADFSHNQDLFDAYYMGKWVTASDQALFFTVFRPEFHCVGETQTASNWNPEILVPSDACFELWSGHDPGATNYGWALGNTEMTKRNKIVNNEITTVEVPVIQVLDELVVVGEDFDLWDFVEQIVEKMVEWEKIIDRPGKVAWRNWSDRSAFDVRIPFSDRLWHQAIFEASGGRIVLMAAERGRGSVNARVDLWRKLLFDERAFISRSRCPHIIDMCKSIRRGTGTNIIAKASRQKHIFDGLTYAVGSELYDELARSNRHMLRRAKTESTLVSV